MSKIIFTFDEDSVKTEIDECTLDQVHFASAKMMSEVFAVVPEEMFEEVISSIVFNAHEILKEGDEA